MKKAIWAAVWAGLAMVGEGASFYVDARAGAGGDGTAAKPWGSPYEAVEGVRKARKAGKVAKGERVEVLFAPGEYAVENSLKLGAEDSGAAGAPVEWKPCGSGAVRFIGGKRVDAKRFGKVTDPDVLKRIPEEARGKVLAADLGDLVKGELPEMAKAFGGAPTRPQLFFRGKFGVLARWPNEGFTQFTKRVDQGKLLKEDPGQSGVRAPGAFQYSDERAKRWDFAAGVWMNGYWTHDWDNHSVKAASWGTENGTNDVVRLAAGVPYGVMGRTWGLKGRRFYVFNMPEELDAPGEWYLDRKKKVLYVCTEGGKVEEADEPVLAFSGNPMVLAAGLKHFRFERIGFEYTYGQMISISNAEGVEIVGCKVANAAGGGIWLSGDRNAVRGTEVKNMGRNGISVNGGDRKTLRRADTLVENCRVSNFGIYQRTYAPGIVVNGCGITVRGNKIWDAPHSAVIYGGNEHLFEYNEVHHVLMETGDAGAYYTGRDWTTQGNVLRFNNTHDLGAQGDHANTMGFYFDDCDCGDEVYGNVFHKVSRGIMIGGGREHPVRNNVFSQCQIGLSIDCRGMTWKHWNSMSVGGESWMLEKKAQKLDYTNGVWAARYPRLAKIMQDHPREPLYNPVEDNVFIDCTHQLLALDGKATECLERMAPIAGNLVINSCGTNGVRTAKPDKRIAAGFRVVNGEAGKAFDAGFADAAGGDFRLKEGAWLRKEMPKFRPLPEQMMK